MTPLKVLVVHRDAAQREAVVSVLRGADFAATAVSNAAEIGTHLDPTTDALFLDLGLPDLNFETLRRALGATETTEPDSLEAAERRHLALVLRHTAGNKRRAALILGISRSTLLNKVRKYRLELGA
jgi:DNA-binding NtrC family response regulator